MPMPASRRALSCCALLALWLLPLLARAGQGLLYPVFDMAPWAYFDAHCEARGIAVETAQAIARRAGLPLRLPHERELEHGPPPEGVVLRLSAVPRRPGMAVVGSRPVFEIDLILVSAAPDRFTAPEALRGRRIGYDRDESRVRERLGTLAAEAVPFPDYPAMVAALRAGTVEAVAGVREGLVYELRRGRDGAGLLRSALPLGRLPVWLHLDAAAPEDWAERLESAVAGFVESGRYASLRDRYLSRAAQGGLPLRLDCPPLTPAGP